MHVSPPDGITWTDASAAAASLVFNGVAGHLVTVSDASEWAFVLDHVDDQSFPARDTWVGLTDIASSGTYAWVTGEPFTFSAWGPGEPTNNENENYIYYQQYDAPRSTILWNDYFNQTVVDSGRFRPFSYIVEWDGDIGDQQGDPNLASAISTISITVASVNDPPVLTSLTSSNPDLQSKANRGSTVTVQGAFSDVDVDDLHAVSIDWGDGSPVTVFDATESKPSSTGLFSRGHVYAEGGFYTITASVLDGNGGTVSGSTTAVVVGMRLVDSTLYIVGSDGADKLDIDLRARQSMLTAKLKIEGEGTVSREFPAANVSKIIAYLEGGHDKVKVAGRVLAEFVAFGGDGNDSIEAGGGNASLFGGNGNDSLRGGRKNNLIAGGGGGDKLRGNEALRNVIIGGQGKDQVTGGAGEDLLIASFTRFNDVIDDPAVLFFASEIWFSTDPAYTFDFRTQLLQFTFVAGTTVFDDGVKDTVKGLAARDWIFANLKKDSLSRDLSDLVVGL